MTIDMLKARIAVMSKLFPDKNGMLAIEDNKPVSFFVLVDENSSKGYWYHPVGVHWDSKKQVVCSEVAEAGPCPICVRIRAMEQQGVPESAIFKLRGPMKIAMNIVVKGEETPRVFLAPRTVGQEIVQTWEAVLNEDDINIFDPMASHAFTVTRSKQDGKTRYEVDFDVNPTSIITGENVEERIARILKFAANLDDRFKLPALT